MKNRIYSMQRCLLTVICGPIFAGLLACTTSPAAPSSLPPASPFVNVVGHYTLTIEVDDKCADIPQPLRVREYDVMLEDSWHYMPVRIVGGRFGYLGGELWPSGPDTRFRFEWNNFDHGGCDYPEATGATSLYLCGAGTGTRSESTISGVILGSAFLDGTAPRARCSGASHRFALVRHGR